MKYIIALLTAVIFVLVIVIVWLSGGFSSGRLDAPVQSEVSKQIEIQDASQLKVLADEKKLDLTSLLLQVGQELHYNDMWLQSMALAYQDQTIQIPLGALKTKALMSLIEHHYDLVVDESYGEEKHIGNLAILLKDLGKSFGTPKSNSEIAKFNKISHQTIHDIHFLNNFLYWYVSPKLAVNLSQAQLDALGWSRGWEILPRQYEIKGIKKLEMKSFTGDDGAHYVDFTDFLMMID